MFPNSLPSENLAVLATIDSSAQAAGTLSSGWVDMRKFLSLLALVNVGVFGASATVDANLQQATDNTGTGAKAITGKVITQLLAAGGNNRQVAINLRPEQLDVTNLFAFVRLNVVVGTAASQTNALVLGVYPRNGLASDFNQAGVAQIVP